MKEVFEEFLQLLEKGTGLTKKELGFNEGASQEELQNLESEIRKECQESTTELPFDALNDLKEMLSVSSGQDERFRLWGGPFLNVKEILEEYPGVLYDDEEEEEEFYNEFQDDDKIRCLIFHHSRIPFSSDPGIIHFLLDFDPAPEGKVGQVIWNISECDYEVLADSLKEFFQLLNKGLKNGSFKVVKVEDYYHEFEIVPTNTKNKYLIETFEELREM